LSRVSAAFPATRASTIFGLRSEDSAERERARDAIARVYRKPLYKRLRLRWHMSPAEAEDLTQDFFAHAFARGVFEAYDPTRSRFRTFVRTCLDRLVSKHEEAKRRLKRGGGTAPVPLDVAGIEAELASAAPADDPDAMFDREWARSLFELGVESMREKLLATGRATHVLLFERYDLVEDDDGRPTYAALAADLGLSVSDVTNYLHVARKEMRRAVLAQLEAVTATDEELREEARALLGVDPFQT
jgi:RNA polymerase sigma-70 factor (ECF subfamily)